MNTQGVHFRSHFCLTLEAGPRGARIWPLAAHAAFGCGGVGAPFCALRLVHRSCMRCITT
jgi:hypothetical protein